jgi:hypothetical protein
MPLLNDELLLGKDVDDLKVNVIKRYSFVNNAAPK